MMIRCQLARGCAARHIAALAGAAAALLPLAASAAPVPMRATGSTILSPQAAAPLFRQCSHAGQPGAESYWQLDAQQIAAMEAGLPAALAAAQAERQRDFAGSDPGSARDAVQARAAATAAGC